MPDEFAEAAHAEIYADVLRKGEAIKEGGWRFAHYTNYRAALAMIDTRELYMRAAKKMADPEELRLGQAIWILSFTGAPEGQYLRSQWRALSSDLDPLDPDLVDAYHEVLLNSTYLISMTTHPARGAMESEARHGRREHFLRFANPDGVAMVVNSPALLNSDEEPKTPIVTTPMVYYEPNFRPKAVVRNLKEVAALWAEHGSSATPEDVRNVVRAWYIHTLVTAKHASYESENEWRAFYSPALVHAWSLPNDRGIVSIEDRQLRSRLERVAVVNLNASASAGLVGTGPTELVDEVIVGPSASAETIAAVMRAALDGSGYHDSSDRVRISEIRGHD